MLPYDISRCAGRAPYSAERCPRKNTCARYLAPAGSNGSPFVLSACEGGDAYIHAATVAEQGAAGHPQQDTPARVLAEPTVRTTGAVGGA